VNQAISRSCFERDGWRCRHCWDRNGLHPHHVIYQSHGGPDELNNLITLCWQCHRAHHDGFLEIVAVEVSANDLNVRFISKKNWRPK
jgi:hypothetical protein